MIPIIGNTSTNKGHMGNTTPVPLTNDAEWQRLWFMLQGRRWSALAVVDATSGADATEVAQSLATIGARDGQALVQVIHALGASFQDVPGLVKQIAEASEHDQKLVACAPVRSNPAMIPILQATSGAVLVVRLGTATTAAVDAIVDAIGRDKVLASISIG